MKTNKFYQCECGNASFISYTKYNLIYQDKENNYFWQSNNHSVVFQKFLCYKCKKPATGELEKILGDVFYNNNNNENSNRGDDNEIISPNDDK